MLPVSQDDVFAINEDGKLCIGDLSLRNYTPKHIKPMITKNKITRRYKNYISAMLPQTDQNKWLLTKFGKTR